MRYIPHTPEDQQAMLDSIGASDISELFSPIPRQLRLLRALELPEPLPECQLKQHMEQLAAHNCDTALVRSFAGAGIYNHYSPAAVAAVLSRSEFYTAYTPYQPEVSQGTLQAIFEYQTMVARLLGMEVSNASMYDGSTALAEAILMALRVFREKRPVVVLAGAIHPEYLAVARTYLVAPDEVLRVVPPGPDGRVDARRLEQAMDDSVAAVVVQSPNFFGLVEDVAQARAAADKHSSLLVVAFTEALAWGLLKPPGALGADIVCGEGQSLGLPTSYGGPLLGIMATSKRNVRSLPGRLVGQTTDRNSNVCFVVTLSTREQHIRRAKATSNICTNEGLCALGASVYLSLLGNEGLHKLATLNHRASLYLARALAAIPGVSLASRIVPLPPYQPSRR